MRFESYAAQFLATVEAKHWQSLDDVLADARRRVGSRRIGASGRVERTGHLAGRVIFNHPAAVARERGAYITPRRRRVLKFANGDFSMHARLRPHPYIVPAGKAWRSTHLPSRLREIR